MRTTGIFEAKQHFSALIEAVASGEEVRITRHGKEVVRMLPVQTRSPGDAASAGQRELAALQRMRSRVKPGTGWKALRDEGRKA